MAYLGWMMIYHSNLSAPDLMPRFRHLNSGIRAFGHSEMFDWADKTDDDPVFGLYKRCGFWTHDEAAILYTIASSIGGCWLDIGTATGWTALHLAHAVERVVTVDPQLWQPSFWKRLHENAGPEIASGVIIPWAGESQGFFGLNLAFLEFNGAVIDGNHDWPEPTRDAVGFHYMKGPEPRVILFHDFMGGAVQKAVAEMRALRGYKVRIYNTPNMVACCWRGEWTPPDHTPDPNVDWAQVWKDHITEYSE